MSEDEREGYNEALRRIEKCLTEGQGTNHLNLMELHLSRLPPKIGNITWLYVLSMGGNRLAELPAEFRKLRKLQFLRLGGNEFQVVPAELRQLTQLRILYLDNNRLTALPDWLAELPYLETLSIDGNPLPFELLELGRRGLIPYLKELAQARRAGDPKAIRRFDEAKLLLVGPGNVGKTWLLQALQSKKPEKMGSTKGLEISRLPVKVMHPTEPKRPLHLNCWDFGGQDHYQITHQIFFSSKAVYLLVWKPRDGIDPDLIARLERIQLSAGQSAKVLIVSTHADGNVPAVIGKEALKERFGDLIWGFYETDSAKGKDGTGIAELRGEIAKAAAQLQGMELEFISAWHEAQSAIRKTKKVTMTFKEFASICDGKGLDAASAADLATIMEVQGHAVFFADATAESAAGLSAEENLVVLDPEWLAKAVGFVLEDKPTMADSGILNHKRLAEIWKEDKHRDCRGYKRELHGYLLWLMWKFDIAYKQSRETSLLPELIQRDRPDDLRWTPAKDGPEPQTTLICRALKQNIPAGLVPALTAAVHPLRRMQNPGPGVDRLDRIWRDGFFLDTALRGTAFVEQQDRELRIVVRDKYPSDLSRRIEMTLDEIVKARWPRLELDRRVPCIGKLNGKPCPGTSRRSLLEKRKGESVLCEDCNEEHEVEKMLEGFDAHEESVMRKLRELDLGQKSLLANQRELMAASFRFFQQALDPARRELERAPRMFTIIPDEGKSWQLLSKATEERLRITCWCEHPDGPHPGAPIGSDEPPDYVLTGPKGWVKTATPYISWAAILLKAFVPMAGTVVQQALGDLVSENLKNHIALMNDAMKALPSGKLEPGRKETLEEGYRLRPEIVALRHIHDALLAHVPEGKRWGDLRPVPTKSGELLWLCAKHAAIQQPPVQQL